MKRLLFGLLGVAAVVIVAALAASALIDANRFRPQVQTALSSALGRQVSLGNLHVALWSGALSADDIRIADDPAFGTQPFIAARSLALGVRIWPLLIHRQLHITSLTLDQPQVRLLQDRRQRWNFAGLGGGQHAAAPAPAEHGTVPAFDVDRLRIRGGRLDLRQAGGDVHRYQDVELDAERVGLDHAFPFSLSAATPAGGTVRFAGTAGPWHAGNALLTPLDAHLAMHDLDLVAAGLMGADAGVGGVLEVDSQLHAEKGVLRSRGRIDAKRLQLVAAGSPAPRPVSVDYQAVYQLVGGTGRIETATLGSGKARIQAHGTFDARPAIMRLNLHLEGRQLPVDDLQPLLPAVGVVLPRDSRLSGGQIGLALDARGPLDALTITGPVTLDDSRLAGYSLGAKLGGALALAGIAAPSDTVIRHAEATLRLDPSGLAADPLRAVIAELGSVSGKGRMAASGQLDARLLVKLDHAVTGAGQAGQGLGGLLGGSKAGRMLGGVLGGTASQGLGVRVAGTASAPRFQLDPAAATDLLKAGLTAGSQPAGQGTTTTTKPATTAPRSDKQALFDSLIQGALQPKQKPEGH